MNLSSLSKQMIISCLHDGKYGLVKCITPENILLSLYNGMMPQTYAIHDFLAAQPENLSQGFIITSVIGIDYKHLQESTNQVPKILLEGIQKGIPCNGKFHSRKLYYIMHNPIVLIVCLLYMDPHYFQHYLNLFQA